ncbi:MAG TPA: carbohydrate porin [Ignavibacteriaceae bacterium]|nr:carbohydrate porin [Ignavibacteriaceae bacterium]
MKLFCYRKSIFICLITLLINCEAIFSQSVFERESLTGDWGGIRTSLSEKGIHFEAVYTGEVFSNLKGGIKRKTVYLDNVDIIFSFDTDKLFSWKGGNIFIYGLGNNGAMPGEIIGDAQTASNIEAFSTWKIYEAWIQQNLFNNKLSLLAGLYDLNSEFQTLESSSLFLNSSHGIGIAFSQSGVNGPSIFPTTSLGFRLKWKVTDNFYFQTVLLNGIPGDPDNPEGTKVTFLKNAGILSTNELQYFIIEEDQKADNPKRENKNRLGRLVDHNYRGKLGAGFWTYSSKFPEITSNSNLISGNSGFYFIGEYKIFDEPNIPEQGLTVFTRIGFANSKINRFSSYTGFGFVYDGLIPGRDEDQFGLAFAGAHNGNEYKSLFSGNANSVTSSEWNIEMTYSFNLFPWLNIQPDFQYIINPNTDTTIINPLAFDIRFSINI